jgi:hypothetical protein
VEERLFLEELSVYTTPVSNVSTDETGTDGIQFGRQNPFAAPEQSVIEGIDEETPVVLE